jgi:AraC-like DNA-binding protein
MEYTPRRVGAIAEEVVFSLAFYFSRQFRHFGRSPHAYGAAMAAAGATQHAMSASTVIEAWQRLMQ